MKKLALAALILLAACSPAAPDDPVAIEGSIVARDAITPTSGNRSTIHVKTTPSEQCGIIFAVDSKTDLLKRTSNGQVKDAALSEFTVGARVRVWAEIIMDSCPGQSFATAIELQP